MPIQMARVTSLLLHRPAWTTRGFLLFKLLDAAVKRVNLLLRVVRNQLLLNMYTTTFNKYLLSTYCVPDSVLDA